MKKYLLVLFLLLNWFILLSANHCRAAEDFVEKKQAAQKLFPAPGGLWEIVDQVFWKEHTVFKLNSVNDLRWYHRPYIAVDQQDQGKILSRGVVHISDQDILKNFNDISISENVKITSENISSYADFFDKVFGLTFIQGKSQPSDLQIETISTNQGFRVKFLWGNDKEMRQIIVDPAGTISLLDD